MIKIKGADGNFQNLSYLMLGKKSISFVYKGAQLIWSKVTNIWRGRDIWRSNEKW